MITPQERARILNHLSQVNHRGFAGDCIRLFVENAHNKTDEQVIETVAALQSQIHDSPAIMKNVLGKKFHFINTYKLPEPCL